MTAQVFRVRPWCDRCGGFVGKPRLTADPSAVLGHLADEHRDRYHPAVRRDASSTLDLKDAA